MLKVGLFPKEQTELYMKNLAKKIENCIWRMMSSNKPSEMILSFAFLFSKIIFEDDYGG